MFQLTITERTSASTIRKFFNRIASRFFDMGADFKYEVANTVFNELVSRTPVDTGRARAGWSVGIYPFAPVKDLDMSVKTANYFAPATFNAPRKIGKHESYQISNPIPYLVYLEMGHSAQAPSGFVNQAIDAGLRQGKSKFLYNYNFS